MSREPVPATPRRAMTPRRRAVVLAAYDGLCAACEEPITGAFDVDHVIALELGGRDDETNTVPLHPHCHRMKTKADQGVIAKVHRIIRKAAGAWNINRQRIQSRPFPKDGPKPRIRSRGFSRRPA